MFEQQQCAPFLAFDRGKGKVQLPGYFGQGLFLEVVEAEHLPAFGRQGVEGQVDPVEGFGFNSAVQHRAVPSLAGGPPLPERFKGIPYQVFGRRTIGQQAVGKGAERQKKSLEEAIKSCFITL